MAEYAACTFSDVKGYKGDILYNKILYYSELNNGLGNLPYKAKLRVTYNGRSVYAYKAHFAAGQDDSAIALHYNLAKALAIKDIENWKGTVTLELVRY
jgi:hypothetical protein